MRIDLYSKLTLTVIALLLAAIASREAVVPITVKAENAERNWYVEPGTTTVARPDGSAQFRGKVMIDMDSGEVWGFPVRGTNPYPVDLSGNTANSRPIYLGKFELPKSRR